MKQGSNKEAILAVMKTTYVIVKIRPEKKNSGSYGIRTQETRVLRETRRRRSVN